MLWEFFNLIKNLRAEKKYCMDLELLSAIRLCVCVFFLSGFIVTPSTAVSISGSFIKMLWQQHSFYRHMLYIRNC